MKKLIISLSVFLAAIVIMLVCTCFIKTSPNLTYQNPETIMIYAKSSVAIKNGKGESTFSKESNTYQDVVKNVEDMFKISMFSRISHGQTIYPNVGQDVEKSKPSWSTSILSKNYAVAFTFKEKQRQIINYQGDTRIIEYFGFIIIAQEALGFTEVSIYFKTSSDGSYTNSPMIAYANTKQLVKYIESIK